MFDHDQYEIEMAVDCSFFDDDESSLKTFDSHQVLADYFFTNGSRPVRERAASATLTTANSWLSLNAIVEIATQIRQATFVSSRVRSK